MHVSRFSCPHCSTQLRIRDRMYVGKIVACPDCSQQFEIVSDGPKKLAARKSGTPRDSDGPKADRKRGDSRPDRGKKKKRNRKAAGKAVAGPTTKVSRWGRIGTFLRNPVTVCWIVAVMATATIVGMILVRNANRSDDGESRTATNSDDDSPTAVGPDQPAMKKAANNDPWLAEQEDVATRLSRIGQLLAAYRKKHGSLPPGTFPAERLDPEQRLSWLALLAAESKPFGTRSPQWRLPWNDAANEPFARQRIHLFRNPRLGNQPGADGLPPTHFVGVAGVGADGPRLPADHPRAGIFAYNRVTRRQDIRDGLGNTMMVAGAQNHIGGWAAGGRGTIRPFTKTPYVNGPDGFGTGHGDRMLVLMADGSVREVSRKTSPVVVRRMAAMNDGFPLDPKVPGDPLDLPSKKKRIPPVAVKKKKPEFSQPPAVAVKPLHVRIGLPLVDVGAALSQPILRFEYTRVPLKTVLAEFEEIAGVPLRIDAKIARGDSSPLNRPVTVKLEKTTLGAILKTILADAGLRYAAEKTGIRVVPAPSAQ
jgi:Alpha-aminoadipate carrier protein LysW-like, globular domain/Protein of unknown function (DUF1559)